jgi:uncharacterized protein
MTNPTTFYNREDRWEIPRELYRNTEIEMLPYYVTTELPGSNRSEFLLMLPLSVADDDVLNVRRFKCCEVALLVGDEKASEH